MNTKTLEKWGKMCEWNVSCGSLSLPALQLHEKKNIFLRISLRVTLFRNAMFWDSSLYLPKEKLFNFVEFYFAFKLQMIDKKERKKKQDKTSNEKQSKILIFFHYIHESHVIICNNLFSYFLSFVKRTKGLFTYTNITGFIKP